jgi:hypothetical protein
MAIGKGIGAQAELSKQRARLHAVRGMREDPQCPVNNTVNMRMANVPKLQKDAAILS